jgi:hypothetical protein
VRCVGSKPRNWQSKGLRGWNESWVYDLSGACGPSDSSHTVAGVTG